MAVLTAFVAGFGSGAFMVWQLGEGHGSRSLARHAVPSDRHAPRDVFAGDAWIMALDRQERRAAGDPQVEPVERDLARPATTASAKHAPAHPAAAETSSIVDLDLLAAAEARLAPEVEVALAEPVVRQRQAHQVDVRRGDTLMDILTRFGIARGQAHAAIASLSDVYDPRRLRIGQQLALELEDDEAQGPIRLASLSLNLDFTQDVVVTRDADGGFAALAIERALRHETVRGAGRIDDSLYLSGERAGVPQDVLAEFIRLFSWDVDFQREIQPGDAFEALFERVSTEDGAEMRGGDVLFAALTVGGRAIEAYRFEHGDGEVDYFDRNGRSLRKFLLRTPIDGARLSSGFGPRRHPVLGYNRMHRGVDFAAPTGTPVFAAGDGVVDFVGNNGGYGKFIRIRHNSEYATAYAHLNGYARGLTRGQRVRQGQIIGYVGTTGMSTGPHLHYEVIRSGNQINPLSVRAAVADALSGRELERFQRTLAAIDRDRRELARGTQLASRSP
jgi:murein DD-endopeptidase MepM/ murein hydrolase activator NlpD